MHLVLLLFSITSLWNTSFPYAFYAKIEKVPSESPELIAYLEQPFDFIGEGSQMVAFASRDGQTILKIFKAHHRRPFKFSRLLSNLQNPESKRVISTNKWDEKFRATCRRYQMAFEHLNEETGLLALHFKATNTPLQVQLKDKKGGHFQIDLKNYPFVIQKRAVLLPIYLENLVKAGRIDEARAAIQRLKAFFVGRTLKGFTDPRQSLSVNYGFINGQPIQLDVGKIEYMPILKQHPDVEIKHIHNHVDAWVKEHFPTISPSIASGAGSPLVYSALFLQQFQE